MNHPSHSARPHEAGAADHSNTAVSRSETAASRLGADAHRSEATVDRSEGDVNRSASRREWQRSNEPVVNEWLERDAAVYLHQALSTPCLSSLRSARGAWLEDEQGRRFLDFHGNSVHQVGHAHPRVIDAVKHQLDTLSFCPRRFTNRPAVTLAERLVELTGGHLQRVLLAPGGAAAMGIALKIVRQATGRHKTISFLGSFHGASLDCISIGGEAIFRRGVGPLLPGALLAPAPAPDRCSLGCKRSCGSAAMNRAMPCLNILRDMLSAEGDVAAVIAEPMRCTTVSIPPADYWRGVRDLCDRHGALLVFDEIPTCLGRTGRMFSYEHFGITPDVLVIGKGLGGAVVPQAAVLVRDSLIDGSATALGHYTHEKSPIGAAAALATLDVIRDEALVERSRTMGLRLTAALESLRPRHASIRDVRGLGLLVGVEIATERPGDAEAIAERTLYAALARGLSFKVSGGNVLTLTPPLIVSDSECDLALRILDEALSVAEASLLTHPR